MYLWRPRGMMSSWLIKAERYDTVSCLWLHSPHCEFESLYPFWNTLDAALFPQSVHRIISQFLISFIRCRSLSATPSSHCIPCHTISQDRASAYLYRNVFAWQKFKHLRMSCATYPWNIKAVSIMQPRHDRCKFPYLQSPLVELPFDAPIFSEMKHQHALLPRV